MTDKREPPYVEGDVTIHKGTREHLVILRHLTQREKNDEGISGDKYLVHGERYDRFIVYSTELWPEKTWLEFVEYQRRLKTAKQEQPTVA